MTAGQNKFSEETMKFRALNRNEKFASLLELCKKLGHIPRPYVSKKYQPDDYARVRAQFYINMVSAKNRGELTEEDIANLSKVDEYLPKKLTSEEKIDLVYEFISKNGRLPTSEDSDECLDALRSLKLVNNKSLDKQYVVRLNAIFKLIDTKKKDLKDRLSEIIKFCVSRKRTPKQHSLDREEKHLADSLSSIKQRIKISAMSEKEKKLFARIMKYAPAARKIRR